MALSKIIGDGLGEVNEASNYEIDMFRLTTDVTSDTSAITNWERVDDASFAKIGTGMSESSGTWTFPRTGLYRVDVFGNIFTTAADQTTKLFLNVTINNSSYDTVAQCQEGTNSSADLNQGASMFALINVTDTSNVKFQLQSASMESGGKIVSDTAISKTAILIERKGPSQ
tara:strand:- start:139 stop:651 length:513 start_codon:yes stop_codon:yes gene_type:complete